MDTEDVHSGFARAVIQAAYPDVSPTGLESRTDLPSRGITRTLLANRSIGVGKLMDLCSVAPRIDPVELLVAMARDRDVRFPSIEPELAEHRRMVRRVQRLSPSQLARYRRALTEIARLLSED